MAAFGSKTEFVLAEVVASDDSQPYWSLGEVVYLIDGSAAPAASDVKSVNGILQANVKSINGIASASIKSINGITW